MSVRAVFCIIHGSLQQRGWEFHDIRDKNSTALGMGILALVSEPGHLVQLTNNEQHLHPDQKKLLMINESMLKNSTYVEKMF